MYIEISEKKVTEIKIAGKTMIFWMIILSLNYLLLQIIL